MSAEEDAPVPLELTDTLDLHPFAAREVASIVRDYVDHAIAQGWPRVRIIHGKGIGALRETVHRVLAAHPGVTRFALAPDASGWGATVVELTRPTAP